MRTLLLFTLFLLLLPVWLCGQQSDSTEKVLIEIKLNDGTAVSGELISETADTVSVRATNGSVLNVPRSVIRSMSYNDSVSDQNHGFLSLGITFGLPAPINLVASYNFNEDVGIRVSGMSGFGPMGGFEGLLYYRLGGNPDQVRIHLAAGGGMSHLGPLGPGDEGSTIRYLGWALYMQSGHFDLTLGLGYPSVFESNYGNGIWPIFQIGWAKHFR